MAKEIILDVKLDTGNSSKTLGDLEKHVQDLKEEIKGVGLGSEEFKKLKAEILSADAQLKNLNKSIEGLDTEALAGEVGKFAGGISAAFTGVSALIGESNQEFEAFMKTVATGMAVTQGIKGATEAWTSASKMLNIVLAANPYAIVIAGVATLAAGILYLISKEKAETEQQKIAREAKERTIEVNKKWNDSIKTAVEEGTKNVASLSSLKEGTIEYKNELNKLIKEYEGFISATDRSKLANASLTESMEILSTAIMKKAVTEAYSVRISEAAVKVTDSYIAKQKLLNEQQEIYDKMIATPVGTEERAILNDKYLAFNVKILAQAELVKLYEKDVNDIIEQRNNYIKDNNINLNAGAKLAAKQKEAFDPSVLQKYIDKVKNFYADYKKYLEDLQEFRFENELNYSNLVKNSEDMAINLIDIKYDKLLKEKELKENSIKLTKSELEIRKKDIEDRAGDLAVYAASLGKLIFDTNSAIFRLGLIMEKQGGKTLNNQMKMIALEEKAANFMAIKKQTEIAIEENKKIIATEIVEINKKEAEQAETFIKLLKEREKVEFRLKANLESFALSYENVSRLAMRMGYATKESYAGLNKFVIDVNDKLLREDTNLFGKKVKLINDYFNKEKAITIESANFQTEEARKTLNLRLKEYQDAYKKEVAIVLEGGKELVRGAEETDEQYNKRREKFAEYVITAIKTGNQAVLDLYPDVLKKLKELDANFITASKEEYLKYTNFLKKIWDDVLKYREALKQNFYTSAQQIADTSFEIADNAAKNRYDSEMYWFNKAQDEKLSALDKAKENGLVTEQQYNDEKEKIAEQSRIKDLELRRKQAKMEKETALFQVAITTALNVAKAWGTGPLAPIAVANAFLQGLLQTAAINSQPLPEFAIGGFIQGVGNPKEDNINAKLSPGESVINAKSTAMFKPILSQINEAGGGVRFDNSNMNLGGNSSFGINKDDLKEIVQQIASIPITNVATETTKVDRQVKNIETKARF